MGCVCLPPVTREGTPQADCRVNGEDWEKGAQAWGICQELALPPATSSESNTSCCKVRQENRRLLI